MGREWTTNLVRDGLKFSAFNLQFSMLAARLESATRKDKSKDMAGGQRLVVNADDFGRSSSINHAVIRAHREGILTAASLMVNEPYFEEAVALARGCPKLGVGLHLTLLCGHSALAREQIPGLVNPKQEFP